MVLFLRKLKPAACVCTQTSMCMAMCTDMHERVQACIHTAPPTRPSCQIRQPRLMQEAPVCLVLPFRQYVLPFQGRPCIPVSACFDQGQLCGWPWDQCIQEIPDRLDLPLVQPLMKREDWLRPLKAPLVMGHCCRYLLYRDTNLLRNKKFRIIRKRSGLAPRVLA